MVLTDMVGLTDGAMLPFCPSDLDPTRVPGGAIYTWASAAAGQRFVVQWDQLAIWGAPAGAEPATFQCMLMADGSIKLQYQRVPVNFATAGPLMAQGSSLPAIGLENIDGREGEQISFGDEAFMQGLAGGAAILIPASCQVGLGAGNCNHQEWSLTVFRSLSFDEAVSDPTCTYWEENLEPELHGVGFLATCPRGDDGRFTGCWCPRGLDSYRTPADDEPYCPSTQDGVCDEIPTGGNMARCPIDTDDVDCDGAELSCAAVDGFSTILRKEIVLPRDLSGQYTFRAEFNDEASVSVIVDDELELVLLPTVDRPASTFVRRLSAGSALLHLA